MDGDLTDESLGEPQLRLTYPVGSGYLQGTTYGWIRDDGEILYVSLDVTIDNTMDGGADYAGVWVPGSRSSWPWSSTARSLRYSRSASPRIPTDSIRTAGRRGRLSPSPWSTRTGLPAMPRRGPSCGSTWMRTVSFLFAFEADGGPVTDGTAVGVLTLDID